MPIKESMAEFALTSEALREYNKMNQYLLGSDLILLLLSLAPIKGNTKLQKQVFLTWKEIFQDVTLDPVFFPWKYGAFSKVIEDAVKILQKEECIDIKKKKGQGAIFLITDKGRQKIEAKMSKLNVGLRNLEEKKTDWDELTPKGIIRYVYRNYPQYTSKTEVPSLKW